MNQWEKDHLCNKNTNIGKMETTPTLNHNIDSGWVIDLDMKVKTIKPLGDNIGEYLHYLKRTVRKDVLNNI